MTPFVGPILPSPALRIPPASQLDTANLEQDLPPPPPATVGPGRPLVSNAREPPHGSRRPPEYDDYDYATEAGGTLSPPEADDYPDTKRPPVRPQHPLQETPRPADSDDYPDTKRPLARPQRPLEDSGPINRPRPTAAAGAFDADSLEEGVDATEAISPTLLPQRPRPTLSNISPAVSPGRPQELPQRQLEEADFRPSPLAVFSGPSNRPPVPQAAPTLLPATISHQQTAAAAPRTVPSFQPPAVVLPVNRRPEPPVNEDSEYEEYIDDETEAPARRPPQPPPLPASPRGPPRGAPPAPPVPQAPLSDADIKFPSFQNFKPIDFDDEPVVALPGPPREVPRSSPSLTGQRGSAASTTAFPLPPPPPIAFQTERLRPLTGPDSGGARQPLEEEEDIREQQELERQRNVENQKRLDEKREQDRLREIDRLNEIQRQKERDQQVEVERLRAIEAAQAERIRKEEAEAVRASEEEAERARKRKEEAAARLAADQERQREAESQAKLEQERQHQLQLQKKLQLEQQREQEEKERERKRLLQEQEEAARQKKEREQKEQQERQQREKEKQQQEEERQQQQQQQRPKAAEATTFGPFSAFRNFPQFPRDKESVDFQALGEPPSPRPTSFPFPAQPVTPPSAALDFEDEELIAIGEDVFEEEDPVPRPTPPPTAQPSPRPALTVASTTPRQFQASPAAATPTPPPPPRDPFPPPNFQSTFFNPFQSQQPQQQQQQPAGGVRNQQPTFTFFGNQFGGSQQQQQQTVNSFPFGQQPQQQQQQPIRFPGQQPSQQQQFPAFSQRSPQSVDQQGKLPSLSLLI